MDATKGDVVSMQKYIESLDKNTLPRILHVCSGVYFQGSVYEVSGSEVCLSTGDMVKVIGINLSSASTEDIKTKETSELPLDYNGLFTVVLEDMPYSTVEEIVGLLPVEPESFSPISFITRHSLDLRGHIVKAGQVLKLVSQEPIIPKDGKPCVRCRLKDQHGASSEVLLPLSCRGQFYEYDDQQTYTLRQILDSSRLQTRYFRHHQTAKCGGPLRISPIYQVQAIMSMRKDVVTFPSSLEVDVVDVTNHSQGITFVTPLSLAEVAAKPPQTFPAVAEVVESPMATSPIKSSWVENLQKGQQLVLHGCRDTPMVLTSTLKSKKTQQYFLISQSYNGRMRRRPREFTAVYELCGALQQTPGLSVTVSRHCEALEEGLDSLSAGDQLDILRCQTVEVRGDDGRQQAVEVLVCRRQSDEDDRDDKDNEDEEEEEDEESRELLLPMYLDGHFMERIKDKKKYSLANLVKHFPLPLDVKVVARDTKTHHDPLVDLPGLQLKETIVEPVVLASLASKPGECFELPSRWLSMTVYLTRDPLPWPHDQPPEIRCENVMELTEAFYYELQSLVGSANTLAPPLPPKQKVKPKECHQSKPRSHRSESLPNQLFNLNLSNVDKQKRSLPPPPLIVEDSPPAMVKKPILTGGSAQPNTYAKTPKTPKKTRTGSDHDYESTDDFLKSAAESIMFY